MSDTESLKEKHAGDKQSNVLPDRPTPNNLSYISKYIMPVLLEHHAAPLFYTSLNAEQLYFFEDYQHVVGSPISLTIIKKRLNSNYYWSSKEFEVDMVGLFINSYFENIKAIKFIKTQHFQRLYLTYLNDLINPLIENTINSSHICDIIKDMKLSQPSSRDKIGKDEKTKQSSEFTKQSVKGSKVNTESPPHHEDLPTSNRLGCPTKKLWLIRDYAMPKFCLPINSNVFLEPVYVKPFNREVIKRPIDIFTINNRLMNNYYSSADECLRDITWMFASFCLCRRNDDDLIKAQDFHRMFVCKVHRMLGDEENVGWLTFDDELGKEESEKEKSEKEQSEKEQSAKEQSVDQNCAEELSEEEQPGGISGYRLLLEQACNDLREGNLTKPEILSSLEKEVNELTVHQARKMLEEVVRWDDLCDGWLMLRKVCEKINIRPYLGISSFLWLGSEKDQFLQKVTKFLFLYKAEIVSVSSIVFVNYGLLLESKKRIAVDAASKDQQAEKNKRKHARDLLHSSYYYELVTKPDWENNDTVEVLEQLEEVLKKKINESLDYKKLMSKYHDKIIGRELISYLKSQIPKSELLCVVSSGIFGNGQRLQDDKLPLPVNANQYDPAMTMLIGGFLPEVDPLIFRLDSLMNFTDAKSDFHMHFSRRLHKKDAKALITIFKDGQPESQIKEKIAVVNTWIRSNNEVDIAMGGVVTHAAYLLKKGSDDEVDAASTGVGIVFCGKSLRAASVVLPKKLSRNKIKKALRKITEEGVVKPGDTSFAFMFSSARQGNQCYEVIFRECFPNTILVGCYGTSQIGVDYYPRCNSNTERKQSAEFMTETTTVVVCSVVV